MTGRDVDLAEFEDPSIGEEAARLALIAAETAATKMIVSPERTVTDPSASFASLPVSIVRSEGPMILETRFSIK